MNHNQRRKSQRLSTKERERLAFTVAALHYGKQSKSQTELAKQLGLSKMQINRLLDLAHQMKFVGTPPLFPPRSGLLESDLYRLLPRLKRVVVSWADLQLMEDQRNDLIAQVAADFWRDYVHPTGGSRLRIALGGGRSLARLIDLVVLDDMGAGIEVLAISNIPYGDWETNANTNLAVLKRKHERIEIRPLLAMQLSPEMTAQDIANDRRRILNLQCVQGHFEAALECSVVFTGIGSLSVPRLRKLFLDIGLTEAELRPPAVGDLGYNMIYHDKEVFHRDDPLSNRLITIPMDTLRQISNNPDRLVVVVAWGKDKAAPALDAYRADVYNSLIIDEEMAEEMIRLIEAGYLSPP